MDHKLKETISITIDNKGVFYIDCFKMLSRNFQKVLKIFEILLSNNCTIVTSNYYITNGYIEKRTFTLKAAHNEYDANKNIQNLVGLSNKHRECLNNILKCYIN